LAEITIPISVTTGSLEGLNNLTRLIESTKQQMAGLGTEWERLPGGGIRRAGRATQPGAGIYTPAPMGPAPLPPLSGPLRGGAGPSPPMAAPSMAVPSAPAGPSPASAPFVQGLPHVRAYGQAVSQVNQQATTLGATLGRLSQVTPLTPPPGQRPLSGRALQLLGAQTPRPPLPAAPAGPPPTPPDEGPGSGLRFLPQRRPPAPDGPGRYQRVASAVESGIGRFATDTVTNVRSIARTGLQVAAGVGVYQTLTHAMELYQERARGIIATGMQLNLNFDQVGNTIDRLRTNYQVLAHDSLGAMHAMGRVTGGFAGLDRAVAFGAAYGIAAPQAAAMAAQLQRQTQAGPNPLATMAGARHLYGVQYAPMDVGALLEETSRMAAIGAAGGGRAPAEYYKNVASLIGSMGQEYQTPGAIAQRFGAISERLDQPPDEATYALRMQAVAQLRTRRQAQGLGTVLNVGGVPLDLANTFEMEAALERVSLSPELQESMDLQAWQMSGGDPRLFPRAQYQMRGGGSKFQALQEQRAIAAQPGRRYGGLGRPDVSTGAEEAVVPTRLQARAERPEFLPQAMEARFQGGLEDVGKVMVTLSNELKKTVADLAAVAREGAIDFGKLGDAMKDLSAPSRGLLGGLMALTATNNATLALGLGLAATAAIPAITGLDWTPTGGHGQRLGPSIGAGLTPPGTSLLPEKPGP
jgi:hypothetical protein